MLAKQEKRKIRLIRKRRDNKPNILCHSLVDGMPVMFSSSLKMVTIELEKTWRTVKRNIGGGCEEN